MIVYTGNVHDEAGDATYCSNPSCGEVLIQRDWYQILRDRLSGTDGHCPECGTAIAGLW